MNTNHPVTTECNQDKTHQSLSYPDLAIPPAGQLTCILPGLFWLRMPLPFKLDHINLYLLREEDGWCVIDCGLANEASLALWQTIEQQYFGDLPVKRIIATHSHIDHMSAAGYLCRHWNAPLFITKGEYEHLRLQLDSETLGKRYYSMLKASGLADQDSQQLSKMGQGLGKMFSGIPDNIQFIEEGDCLSIGRYQWQIIVSEGHCIAHASLYCAEAGVLISGDQVLPGISSNVSVRSDQPEGNPLQAWLEGLQQLKSLPDDLLILPAHETPFYGLHIRLEQLIDEHHQQLEKLVSALDSTDTEALLTELISVLYPRKLSHFDRILACGECLAHLHYLRDTGRIAKSMHPDGIWRFRSVCTSDLHTALIDE